MKGKERRQLEHWIDGLIGYPSFAWNLIDGLNDNNKSEVKSSIILNGKAYDLNITLKEKEPNITVTVDIDTEPVLDKIKELKKETGALDLSVNRERIKKFEEGV